MTNEPPITFSMEAPYPLALRMVRRALAQHGLQTPAELDVAGRIKRELGAGVAPCTVLYVDDPVLLLEAVVFHRGAPLGALQPVVISGTGHGTEVQIRNSESLVGGKLPASMQDPLLRLHDRILRAIEMVAERDDLPKAGSFELCSTHSTGDLICKRSSSQS